MVWRGERQKDRRRGRGSLWAESGGPDLCVGLAMVSEEGGTPGTGGIEGGWERERLHKT